jgi:hypothetical protein
MNITEERRNKFLLKGTGRTFAHCISADCEVGAGIARQFAKQYPGIKQHCLQCNPG